MKVRFALSWLLATWLLAAHCCVAQQQPEEAVAELITAQDEPGVRAHLPEAMNTTLEKAPQERREEFLALFMVGKLLAAEGVELSRISDSPLTYELAEKNTREMATVTHTGTEIRGTEAAVYFQVTSPRADTSSEREQLAFVVDMRLEGNTWRLINVEKEGKRLLPDLDQPQLALNTLTHDKMVTNESSAVGSLRTINTAQVTYAAMYEGIGYSPDLKSLGPAPDGERSDTPEHSGLVDATLGCADPISVKSGYKFVYQRIDKEHYRVSAMPLEYRVTGVRSFFTDQSGIIRVTTEDREAHENDDPLQ